MSADWKQDAAEELLKREEGLIARKSALVDEIRTIEARLSEIQVARRALGIELAVETPSGLFVLDLDQPIKAKAFKDTVLELLKGAYPAPMKAADVQAQAEARIGSKFHPKTSGMTLYRLAQDGLVRREGHKWFFVPEENRRP